MKMNRNDLSVFVDAQIKDIGTKIIEPGTRADEFAYGKMHLYLALRRFLDHETDNKKPPMEDLGLFDGISDLLQEAGLLKRDQALLNALTMAHD
jgi:hypothetical protein